MNNDGISQISKDTIYKRAKEAAETIPESYDAYAQGLVTKGRMQVGPICYSYAATAVMETCFLKATVNTTTTPKPHDGPLIHMAENFAQKCKQQGMGKGLRIIH